MALLSRGGGKWSSVYWLHGLSYALCHLGWVWGMAAEGVVERDGGLPVKVAAFEQS